MPQKPAICYLCGEKLSSQSSADHVPPRQLYTKAIRKAHSPNLLTIPVHAHCNRAYQHDEDHFVNALAPYGTGSYAGNAILHDVTEKYRAGKKVALVHKILNGFDHAPGGIYLPPGLVAQRIEGERIHRVAWKIVRGLYFHKFGEYLPEQIPNSLEIAPPDRPPPLAFLHALHDLESQGSYPGVFDYKCAQYPAINNFNYWGMLFWDRLILIRAFHSPSCACEHCINLQKQNEKSGSGSH